MTWQRSEHSEEKALRKPHRGSVLAAGALMVIFTSYAATPSTQPTSGPAISPETAARRVQRPLQTQEEYTALAASLRKQYSKPPDQWPEANIDPGVEFHELGKLPPVQYPNDNPYSKPKEELGKMLFFDPRLSSSGQIACASCHDPDLAWADGRTNPFGHDRQGLKRNAPSVLFSAYVKPLFWDGRADSLEEQFASPLLADNEMHGQNEAAVLARLNAVPEYLDAFKAAFDSDKITMANAAKAVATFERSLAKNAGRSAFDRFLDGKNPDYPDAAIRGLNIFRTSGRCINCHNGPLLSDNKFHDLGLSYYQREFEDLGRYEVTKDPSDVGRFKTPPLRDVGRTRPYMHNGFFDLDGILNAYNMGMGTLRRKPGQENDPMFPTKDPILQPLHMNQQDKADLKAFLETLSEPPLRTRPPKLPGMAKAN
jgi:cytochrome c peroxidase